ncbi:MAG TPA: DNA repair protein RadA [Oceanithermus profundus]|uniref:DNA repair protein RadA n=1 Tax=Oceanithermus profundus TaxID=187137 RepID=A0A7C4VB70_9DEIN|nr:DNA repair protein RadA [Oceanithermus profundus]
MARSRTQFRCVECGYLAPKPLGRCPSCGAWGSFSEDAGPAAVRDRAAPAPTLRLGEVTAGALPRFSSGIEEVDRVLGGGFVPGAALLIGGEPGVGKSTLLLQVADRVLRSGRSVVYVAGEESPEQVKLRAERLGVDDALALMRETGLDAVLAGLEEARPELVVVDSIQTLESEGVPGSLVAVRNATQALVRWAKGSGATLVLVGHVTKEGTVAGPKVIEHVVDATLYLETAGVFRVLRSAKNRFGAVGEVGVFRMEHEGMVGVSNPSEAFLAERPRGVPGSAVGLALYGERAIALEVQALAAKSPYPAPKRVAQGLDARRVDVVLAVLERRLGLKLGYLDVYVNLAGGLRVKDPGLDLAVAIAVYSAVMGRPVDPFTAAVGEVGLAGEVRSAGHLEARLREGERAGFRRVLQPGQVTSVEQAVKEALT